MKTYIVKFIVFGKKFKIRFTTDKVVTKENVLNFIKDKIKVESISEEIYTEKSSPKSESTFDRMMDDANSILKDFFGDNFKL